MISFDIINKLPNSKLKINIFQLLIWIKVIKIKEKIIIQFEFSTYVKKINIAIEKILNKFFKGLVFAWEVA
ncbi:hypothetical protein MSATCC33130_2390 [Metamycoplasma salivarium]|nr:hypothetical protein MSATCC23557_2230 [Metamycoplasma salivarium]GIZ06885.1 hypothetical protein MSATCC33130_2390 [Metamycoplasma salivarium]